MKKIILILTILLMASTAMAQSVTVSWDKPQTRIDGTSLSASEQAQMITVIETATISGETVKWSEVGRVSQGATSWAGSVPEVIAGVRAKHILNGLSSAYSTIMVPVQPGGVVVVIK